MLSIESTRMCLMHLWPHLKYIQHVLKVYRCLTKAFVFSVVCTADNFNGTDEHQDNAVMGLAYSTFQRILGNSPQVLNPIDRLYSMQNYYFRCNNRQPNEPDDNHHNDGM